MLLQQGDCIAEIRQCRSQHHQVNRRAKLLLRSVIQRSSKHGALIGVDFLEGIHGENLIQTPLQFWMGEKCEGLMLSNQP